MKKRNARVEFSLSHSSVCFIMKRTPLKPKKFYTLKKTPLKSKSSVLKSTEIKKQNDKKREQWEEAREKRLKKDNYRCVVCKKPATEVHHVHLRSKRPDLLFNQNNLRSLCSKHHFHSGSDLYKEQCQILAIVEGITVEELLKKAEQPEKEE